MLQSGVAVQEVLALAQGTAEGLVVVEQTVEIRERERPARGRVDPRRRTDHGDCPAIDQRQRDGFVQRQAALQKHQARRQRLGPVRDSVVLDERLVMALPKKDVALRQRAPQVRGVDLFFEAGRDGVAGVAQLLRRRAGERLQERQAPARIARHERLARVRRRE